MKIIDADRFVDGLMASAITIDQRVFAEKVKHYLKDEPPAKAIPIEYIRKESKDPGNAGYKSAVLSGLIHKWEKTNEKN